MDVEDIKVKLLANWDHKGVDKYGGFFGEQKDWNQTIISRINEISTHIHMASCTSERLNGIGPADAIMMNYHCFKLIKDLEYFKPEEMRLGKGFEVIVNNFIGENAVFVFKKDIPKDYKNKDRTVGVVKILNY